MEVSNLPRLEQETAVLGWIDPVDAYRILVENGHRAMLLYGDSAHPDARWSFLALDPIQEVRVRGRTVEDLHAGGSSTTTGNVLGHLGALFDAARRAGPEAAPFTGGWVGYLGYEFASSLDAILPRHARGASTPDAFLWLCPDVVAFDAQSRRVHLFCAEHEDHPRARHRMALLQAVLANTKSTRGPPSPAGPPATLPEVQSTLGVDAFMVEVAKLRSLIHDGDLFQANLATRFSTSCAEPPIDLFDRLRRVNPAPFMFFVEDEDHAVVSGSPELLVRIQDGRVESRPMAGTRRRHADPDADRAMEVELRTDPKEQAEHTMLVDLVRNDVARIARTGSVHVRERMMVERYLHVMHLTSLVAGELRSGVNPLEVLAALFPGGTITGAPKPRACQRILEAEGAPRGIYTGSAGYVSWTGNMAFNILIRTLLVDKDPLDGQVAYVHAGSGIVADSDAQQEWKEARRKAQALLDVVLGAHPQGTRLGEVTSGTPWLAPSSSLRLPARVLLVDNEDSFVHNLADYCARLGATTSVVRSAAPWREEVRSLGATHIILGPGPGRPQEASTTWDIARHPPGIPVLGVCLGHQALAAASGATVEVHPRGPVHGKTARIHHNRQGLFAGLPQDFRATRYHSLTVRPASCPPDWIEDAHLDDGTVMALRNDQAKLFGLQFHPESLCTEHGLELIARFLEAS